MRPFKGPHLSDGVRFTTPGTSTWTVPAGVTSICVLCIGPGGSSSGALCGGGGGGALAYKNAIAVTAGSNYTVVVGSPGTDSSFAVQGGSTLVLAKCGADGTSTTGGAGGAASASIGDARYSGGNGAAPTTFVNPGGITFFVGGGGGGAAGYAGNGGNGGAGTFGNAGAGGGGGGGAGYLEIPSANDRGGGGGGVGLLGQGSNGNPGSPVNPPGREGRGGSGGTDAALGTPGSYGGGAGGSYSSRSGTDTGANGVVRIIWGPGRAFPSTFTGGT